MIRKLIASLALVGAVTVGLAGIATAETSPGPAPSTRAAQERPAHERRCARATRAATRLEKWHTQLEARIEKLQAKQAEVAQTDADKAAKIGELIAKLQQRSTQLKDFADKVTAGVAEHCLASAPA